MFGLSYLVEYSRYLNLIGIGVVLTIAYLFSFNRNKVNYRLVATGLALQWLVAFIMLKTWIGHQAVGTLAHYVTQLYQFADQGSQFIFGSLVDATGPWGFIFGIKVLPVIIFFGAFMSILFYLGIVQRIVFAVSIVVRPLLGTSGVETLCAIANSFLGQTEAPLLVRHYLKNITRSEMLVVMVSGMATISGAILVVFAAMGVPVTHLLASSVMSIPASIVIAKILCPQEEESSNNNVAVKVESQSKNLFDAVAQGTIDGLHLALNVGAMLISFLALLALINGVLVFIGDKINLVCDAWQLGFTLPPLTLNLILSYLCAPFGYLLGFTGKEALAAGQLIGIKVAVNEVIAYGELVKMDLPQRTVDILTYALCGFSNFSCIGIQIGGIGALAPEKRGMLSQLGLYAVLGGTLSNLLSALTAAFLL